MSTGKDVTEFGRPMDAEKQLKHNRRILISYLLLLVTQLPLASLYIWSIWTERLHYSALPLAFVAFGLFLYQRWPRKGDSQFFGSLKSDVLLMIGVILGTVASILLSPWFGFAAFLGILASLLARTNDGIVFGTLLSTIAPLVVLLQPPLAIDFDTVQGDIAFQGWLEYGSTQLASDILDLSLYPHNSSGYRIEFPTQSFSSVDLGKGIYSVFSVLIFTGIYIGAFRIPSFRGLLLMAAAIFWFMVFEALELSICVVAMLSFENDLYSSGIGNSLLQSFTLLATGVMTLLSERLIKFLFGPVELQAIDENISYQNKICKFWNSAIAGVSSAKIDVNVKQEVAWAKKRNNPPELSTLYYIRGMVALLGLLCIWQVVGLTIARNQLDGAELNSETIANVGSSDSPFQFPNGFKVLDSNFIIPQHKSAWETDSFEWVIQDDLGRVFNVILSFPFSGWHNFDYELESHDWNRDSPLQEIEIPTNDNPIPCTTAEYQNTLVVHRTLFNAQLDSFGEGFERPLMWTDPASFTSRLKNRVANRTRPRVFSGLSVSLTVFLDSVGPNNPEDAEQAKKLFELIAKQLQSSLRSGEFPHPSVISEQ